eukprot:8829164-Pyramimonas_sp.AAC.1
MRMRMGPAAGLAAGHVCVANGWVHGPSEEAGASSLPGQQQLLISGAQQGRRFILREDQLQRGVAADVRRREDEPGVPPRVIG